MTGEMPVRPGADRAPGSAPINGVVIWFVPSNRHARAEMRMRAFTDV